jgi:hypothetical protein
MQQGHTFASYFVSQDLDAARSERETLHQDLTAARVERDRLVTRLDLLFDQMTELLRRVPATYYADDSDRESFSP